MTKQGSDLSVLSLLEGLLAGHHPKADYAKLNKMVT